MFAAGAFGITVHHAPRHRHGLQTGREQPVFRKKLGRRQSVFTNSPFQLRRCWPCRFFCFCSSACWSPAENANRNDKSRLAPVTEPGGLFLCGNVQRAYCWACSARLAPICLSSGVLKKSFLPSAKGPCMQPGGLYDVPCMEEHLCRSCPCGTRRDPGVHSTSATATSLTFVPVAPVRMSPPTACKAW